MSTVCETTTGTTRSQSQVVDLYAPLSSATDDRSRARIIAETFTELGQRYPHIPDLLTCTILSETGIELTKEIEQVRAELKETELRLTKEIEQVRHQTGQVRSNLCLQLEKSHISILKWTCMFWVSQLAVILTILWRVSR